MLFEAGRALFMKNWKIYSRKTSMVLAVKAILKLILSHSKTIWWTSVSQNGCEVSCPLRFLAITWGVLINYDSTTVNIAVFIEQRNISFQNDISLKTTRLGVLSCEKLKHCETRGRIVSLDQLCLGVEEQLLIFSASCLSPGWVKKLQKFINFCLKVGHSSNFKHSRSTWVHRPVTPVKCTKSAHRGTGTIYGSCRFDIKRFRVEPTDLRKVSTSEWQICMSHCPQ